MKPICIKKNAHEKREMKTIKVNVSSMISGNKLKMLILRTDEKDWEPLETILIILPVSLPRWNAKHYLWM
jgi:hypothetical protein